MSFPTCNGFPKYVYNISISTTWTNYNGNGCSYGTNQNPGILHFALVLCLVNNPILYMYFLDKDVFIQISVCGGLGATCNIIIKLFSSSISTIFKLYLLTFQRGFSHQSFKWTNLSIFLTKCFAASVYESFRYMDMFSKFNPCLWIKRNKETYTFLFMFMAIYRIRYGKWWWN